MSPYQVFVSGILANDSRRQLLFEESIDPRHFGVDALTVDDEYQVICDPPVLPFPLTDSQQEQLTQCLSATQFQYNFGISQYNAALQLLEQWYV